ncbi:HK97 family phage prohead protease [Rhizobium rhizogenes]|uniref:Prohead protease n=1 Tax=Rhizobium rhizogenes NBRC 13257 TaxID=1220581 RepID=A0AA87QAX9_RHIRH|nr:HK97 family phage prohead protease [Rhizobium rhizogenes]NTG60424.1 HK97 family phage prohead protease [Rhizobium rhizogenes]NTG66974.1 HK97 family phage prohead protease [Rhizobium rhizogenes]NTG79946.1 HK97 family phage prohead protease [Rhizobium rhizogenes]NTH95627.1 HK97 family phage prohead protease [Rhizobium rhizogenes]NTI67838.1 HK97 family phage prohead protease [Rhizobium rhizogenes]
MTLEKRAATDVQSSGKTIVGYIAKFNNTAQISDFSEEISPGAFSESLRSNPDILFLQDHQYDRVIGRTANGSLKLAEDYIGLRFELTPVDTAAGRDALEMVRTKTAGGLSFGFTVDGPDSESWTGSHRTLKRINLREASLVSSFPAYSGTEASVRSRQPMTDAERRIRILELEGAANNVAI